VHGLDVGAVLVLEVVRVRVRVGVRVGVRVRPYLEVVRVALEP